MNVVDIRAYAKINATLEVLGHLGEGFHEITSVVQTVDIFDTLTFEHSDDITLDCDQPGLALKDNLVLAAANMLKQETGYCAGASISLQKRIPVASGLGGGSSDAAATLNGLNKLWDLGFGRNELQSMASRLGSDVSFFLRGGTALLSGRGDCVEYLPPAVMGHVVILSPRIYLRNKTKILYGTISPKQYTNGNLTCELAMRISDGEEVLPIFLGNVFDEVCRNVFEEIDGYWETLHSISGETIHVTGSGPSLFLIVDDEEQGSIIHSTLKRDYGWQSHFVSAWHPE